MIVGHEEIRHALGLYLAPVTLLEGPDGIGKRLVAREAASRVASRILLTEVGADICTQLVAGESGHNHTVRCEVMTTGVARYILQRCQTHSGGKAFIFDAGKATPGALNSLLKVLEEPPERVYFVMYASTPVSPTVASRAARFQMLPLSDDQVERLLRSWEVPPERAARATRMAAGRPGAARVYEEVLRQKASVLSLLRAVAEADPALLTNALKVLTPANVEEQAEWLRVGSCQRARNVLALFEMALTELRTGQYRAWDSGNLLGLKGTPTAELDRALRMLKTNARPELTLGSAAAGLIASRRQR